MQGNLHLIIKCTLYRLHNDCRSIPLGPWEKWNVNLFFRWAVQGIFHLKGHGMKSGGRVTFEKKVTRSFRCATSYVVHLYVFTPNHTFSNFAFRLQEIVITLHIAVLNCRPAKRGFQQHQQVNQDLFEVELGFPNEPYRHTSSSCQHWFTDFQNSTFKCRCSVWRT